MKHLSHNRSHLSQKSCGQGNYCPHLGNYPYGISQQAYGQGNYRYFQLDFLVGVPVFVGGLAWSEMFDGDLDLQGF